MGSSGPQTEWFSINDHTVIDRKPFLRSRSVSQAHEVNLRLAWKLRKLLPALEVITAYPLDRVDRVDSIPGGAIATIAYRIIISQPLPEVSFFSIYS